MTETPENSVVTTEVVTPSEKKRRGRRKKAELQSSSTHLEDKSSPRWFPIIANLALLVAIFTIVFAAHIGLQGAQKQDIAERQIIPSTLAPAIPQTVEATPEPEVLPKPTVEKIAEAVPAEVQQPVETPTANPAPAPATVDCPQPQQIVVEEPKKQVDEDEVVKVVKKTKPKKRHLLGSLGDYKNPWNAGGDQDLDAEPYRAEYKKTNYIVISSTDEPTAPALTPNVAGPAETPAENTGAEPQK